MCSVTFWPQGDRYLLAMNRDELLSRVAGLPPARSVVGSRIVVHPSEPGGGTWISVNDRGVSIALVNWYEIPTRAPEPTASRGGVVWTLRDCLRSSEALSRLHQLPLSRMNPFRAVGVFPAERVVHEWRWNQRELTSRIHPWSPGQWLSSGYDEPAAQRIRAAAFESMRTDSDAGSTNWARRLHASHAPERGPFSTCMHRADAETVSYTEVEVQNHSLCMRYHNSCLCSRRALSCVEIPLGREGNTG